MDIFVSIPVAGDLVALRGRSAHDRGVGGRDLAEHEERGVGVMVPQERKDPLHVLDDPTVELAADPRVRSIPKDRCVIVFLDVDTERVEYHVVLSRASVMTLRSAIASLCSNTFVARGDTLRCHTACTRE